MQSGSGLSLPLSLSPSDSVLVFTAVILLRIICDLGSLFGPDCSQVPPRRAPGQHAAWFLLLDDGDHTQLASSEPACRGVDALLPADGGSAALAQP